MPDLQHHKAELQGMLEQVIMSKHMSKHTSKHVSKHISEHISEHISKHMSTHMPKYRAMLARDDSEQVALRAAEDLREMEREVYRPI